MGQEPALPDIPHVGMNLQSYQAMIDDDDDDWLQDFASAQLQVASSPASVHTEPVAEQPGQHALLSSTVSNSEVQHETGPNVQASLNAS